MPPARCEPVLEGFVYYLTPHLEGLTVSRFLQILLDAMSQLFFSLSVSMGIMITYGSYVKPDVNLNRAVNQIEFFDTGVALGRRHDHPCCICLFRRGGHGRRPQPDVRLAAQVFNAMGAAGVVVGVLFFVAAIFADPYQLHLGAGVHCSQLHGDPAHQPQKDPCWCSRAYIWLRPQ